jgi:hypothetical protein
MIKNVPGFLGKNKPTSLWLKIESNSKIIGARSADKVACFAGALGFAG